jgi:hypothetical protein
MITAKDAFNGEVMILASYVLFLLIIPKLTMKLFGIAEDPTTFWPRVLGAGAGGILLGVIAQDQGWTKSGIGLGGCVEINLTLAIALAAMMLTGPKMPTPRGTATIWGMAASHAVLGFVQIAFA